MIRPTKFKNILAAVTKRLRSSQELKVITKGVYDWVPEKTDYPYVTFGDMNALKDMTKTTYGSIVALDILVWDMAKGRERSLDIMDIIERELEEDLEIVDVGVITQDVEYMNITELKYGLYSSVIRINIRVEEDEY